MTFSSVFLGELLFFFRMNRWGGARWSVSLKLGFEWGFGLGFLIFWSLQVCLVKICE